MEFNQNCLLCLAKSDCINSIKDTKIGCHSLRDVIMQHFWFKLNETIDYPDTVCSNCYDKLTNFHEYYLYVKEIHSNYDETKTSIKLETPSADIKDLDVICKLESPKHSEIDNFDYQSSSSSSDSVAQMNGRTRKILTNQKRSSVGRIKRQQNRKYLNDQRDRILELFVMACDLCDGIKFNSLEDACKHYRTVHGKDGYLICCGKRHKYAFRIAEHLRYHENPEEFKCKLCEKSFIDKRALSYHMEVHVPKTEKLFKCKYCEKSYSKNVTLKKHVRASHPNGSGKPVESFQCDECGRKFCFKGSLRSHIDNAHRKLYSKICEICAQVFKQSQAYELHYKVMHTMELKRVQCEQCGSWFKHNESLRIHKRSTCVKTGKSETCTVCGKIAPSRSALNIHIRRSHNSISKSFPCTICEKVFKRTTMLKEHMALHTGEILYTCSFCSKTFRSSANMYRHYKVTHPVEYKEKKKITNRGASCRKY